MQEANNKFATETAQRDSGCWLTKQAHCNPSVQPVNAHSAKFFVYELKGHCVDSTYLDTLDDAQADDVKIHPFLSDRKGSGLLKAEP